MTPEQKRKLRDERRYIKPILKMLQDNGGELQDTSQIDRLLPSYSDLTEEDINYSEITNKGNKYVPYWFGRNFAMKNLQMAGFLTYSRNEPITLTPKGVSAEIAQIDIDRDIYQANAPLWEAKRRARQQKHIETQQPFEDNELENTVVENVTDGTDDYKTYILEKVKSLDPIKFEQFARGLLKKMGFDIDPNKGIKASGDGGIDGFAYCTDDQSLKTTRVAIQCKRYTNSPVGGPEVNNLRGAIDTHRADYGVLLTTSYFSREAIESSRTGSTSVTLIDGQKLVDLMIQYKYKVREVPTYIVDEQYFDE